MGRDLDFYVKKTSEEDSSESSEEEGYWGEENGWTRTSCPFQISRANERVYSGVFEIEEILRTISMYSQEAMTLCDYEFQSCIEAIQVFAFAARLISEHDATFVKIVYE